MAMTSEKRDLLDGVFNKFQQETSGRLSVPVLGSTQMLYPAGRSSFLATSVLR